MKTVKVRVIKNVVARVADQSFPLKVGDIIEIPADDADNLVRGKYAEEVATPEKKKNAVDIVKKREEDRERAKAALRKDRGEMTDVFEEPL